LVSLRVQATGWPARNDGTECTPLLCAWQTWRQIVHEPPDRVRDGLRRPQRQQMAVSGDGFQYRMRDEWQQVREQRHMSKKRRLLIDFPAVGLDAV